MVLAYQNGAKYIIIFDYPKINELEILTNKHLKAIRKFWDYLKAFPHKAKYSARTAYVLPKDYGYGFRGPDDKIWGLWGPDELSPKIWNCANNLLGTYDPELDVIYEVDNKA